MKELFPDWRAQGVTVCLHEKQGGFAFNLASVEGLHGKCRSEGVEVLSGVEVTGFTEADDGTITAVETSAGVIEVGEQVVSRRARGRRGSGRCSGSRTRSTSARRRRGRPRPADVDVLEPPGGRDHRRPPRLREGGRRRPAGHPPRHGAPLYTDDGKLVTDELWGIYFKRDRHGVQGGASPLVVDGEVELDRTRRRPTSTRHSPTCGARRSRTRCRVSRAAGRCTRTRGQEASAHSRSTTSPSSTTSARTSTGSSTRTTATR